MCCIFLQTYELLMDRKPVCPYNCRGCDEPFQSGDRQIVSRFQAYLAEVDTFEDKRSKYVHAPPHLPEINWLEVNHVHSFRFQGYHNTALHN